MNLNSIFALLFALISCGKTNNEPVATLPKTSRDREIVSDGKTLELRFPPPAGFKREPLAENSFGWYLRHLPLKAADSPVYLFDGRLKSRQDVHAAVFNIDVGNSDLQQCADAVMRLRAEYLFTQNRFEDIHFNFTNGFRADYTRWQTGERIFVERNRATWRATGTPSTSYESFRSYLNQVFMYAGTLSLSKELKPVSLSNLQIGDIFIQGGSPGHAVIVVDIAKSTVNESKVFLLAQSYMPAQEIHLLNNWNDRTSSPWYALKENENLPTPEWTFSPGDLKRF